LIIKGVTHNNYQNLKLQTSSPKVGATQLHQHLSEVKNFNETRFLKIFKHQFVLSKKSITAKMDFLKIFEIFGTW